MSTTTVTTAERPILFSAEMVRAILAGRKTQTRRVVKRQPPEVSDFTMAAYFGASDGLWHFIAERHDPGDLEHPPCLEEHLWDKLACPYGVPGDFLWVRERFRIHMDDGLFTINYAADDSARELQELPGPDWDDNRLARLCNWNWRPSIHMPRWACRLVLEVTKIRVEQLQEITPGDIKAEGFPMMVYPQAIDTFSTSWNAINGARGFGWETNPWVWVVEFERVT